MNIEGRVFRSHERFLSSNVYSFQGIYQITFHIDFLKTIIILRKPLQWAGFVCFGSRHREVGRYKQSLFDSFSFLFFFFQLHCTAWGDLSSPARDRAHGAALQSSFLTTGRPEKSLSFITSRARHESNKETLISTVLHGLELRWADQSRHPAPRWGKGHYPTPQSGLEGEPQGGGVGPRMKGQKRLHSGPGDTGMALVVPWWRRTGEARAGSRKGRRASESKPGRRGSWGRWGWTGGAHSSLAICLLLSFRSAQSRPGHGGMTASTIPKYLVTGPRVTFQVQTVVKPYLVPF